MLGKTNAKVSCSAFVEEKILSPNITEHFGAEAIVIIYFLGQQEKFFLFFNHQQAGISALLTPFLVGLLEAGIKSIKTNLSRVNRNQILTFENISTTRNSSFFMLQVCNDLFVVSP